jgi:hypothetical protein
MLSGCVTAEQRMQMAAAQNAADDQRCRSYGAEPGTPAYTQCRMEQDRMRFAQAQLAAQQADAAAASMQRAAAYLQGPPAPAMAPPPPVQAPRPVICTRAVYGGVVCN